MIPNNQFFFNSDKGTPYDSDAELYFAQLIPQPSDAYKAAINTLIIQLKADGNWTTLDRLWIHAAEDSQNACVSVKNPTSATVQAVNSPTFTANQGFTGNGANARLFMNYIPSVDGVNFTLNSACYGVYARLSQSNDTSIIMGTNTTGVGEATLALNWTGLGKLISANAIGQDIIANNTTQGFYSVCRTAANLTTLYKNGVSLGTSAAASTARSTLPFYVLAWNNNGVISNFSSNQVAISYIGGNVTQGTFYTALQAFATTIGFNV